MKKILCLLLIITAVFALTSCEWYEKSIRVTVQNSSGPITAPDESGEEEKTDETNDPNATNGPDYTVPPSTENKGGDEKPDKTQIPDDHEKTEESTTHGPDYDGNGNGIPDALESTDKNDPSITEPSITDVPTPPPAPTESPSASEDPFPDKAIIDAVLSSYVDFCNSVGTFENSADIDPIAIFEHFRYYDDSVLDGTESKGMVSDSDGEYELIIETYDVGALNNITRAMFNRDYNYEALNEHTGSRPGCDETFTYDPVQHTITATIKFYGGAGYGPQPYFAYVDYEQNGNEFTVNALYMDIDENDEEVPVKYYKLDVTFTDNCFILNSFTENPDKPI